MVWQFIGKSIFILSLSLFLSLIFKLITSLISKSTLCKRKKKLNSSCFSFFYRHGVKQLRNPWFDGPEYITQCPIPAGTNFTYQVLLSSEEGTLFWHAHSDWTRATVHGALVILPAEGTTYPFPKPDEEQVLVFGMHNTYPIHLALNVWYSSLIYLFIYLIGSLS